MRIIRLITLVSVAFVFQSSSVAQSPSLPTAIPVNSAPQPGDINFASQFDRPAPILLASYPDSTEEIKPPPELTPLPPPDRPPSARAGIFQKLKSSVTWMAGGSSVRDLGITNLDIRAVLAAPLPLINAPLIITPGFGVSYLDGPIATELPARVFDSYTQFCVMKQVNPQWGFNISITPGVYSDFEQGTSEGFRLPGHGLVALTCNPKTKLLLGVAYPDRQDIKVMPIGGLIWTPNEDLKFEMFFPRPQISKRVYWFGQFTEHIQDWAYVAGEFGGGTWAFRRTDDTDDTFTYHDYRLIIGLKRNAVDGLDSGIDIGYIFGREIEYTSNTPSVKPSDTVMIRARLTY